MVNYLWCPPNVFNIHINTENKQILVIGQELVQAYVLTIVIAGCKVVQLSGCKAVQLSGCKVVQLSGCKVVQYSRECGWPRRP